MSNTRNELSLAGTWRSVSDTTHLGEALGYHRPDHLDTTWREVDLPAVANEGAAGLGYYTGPTWYRRIVQVPGTWRGQRIYFHCDGANYHTKLYVNGQLAGQNNSGHLQFEFQIDHLLNVGAWNLLVLVVDGLPMKGENPGTLTGWQHIPGILRPIHLESRPPTHIARVRSWAEPTHAGGRLRLSLDIEGAEPSKPLDITVRRLGRDWQQPLSSDWMDVPDVKPWTPELPHLYRFEIDLRAGGQLLDTIPLRLGFRTIEAREGQLRLNGAPLYLCGFNRHEDSPSTAMLADPRNAREDLRRIKLSGANFVRLCHYPHDPRTLDLCDELGLLVMCEVPLYWLTSRAGREQECQEKLEQARDQLRRLIQRDRNHPSVIFWSVSNETDESCPDVQDANHRLLTLAREMDDSRLIVHVSNSWPSDPHFDTDDVICINGYPNVWPWTRAPTDLVESAQQWRDGIVRLQKLFPGKPVLITEFGHPAIEGETAGQASQQRQLEAISAEAAAFDLPGVCGMTVWCWADHLWPPGTFMDGMGVSPFGVVTRSREPKLALNRVSEIFRSARHLAPATSRPVALPEGLPDVVMVRPAMQDLPRAELPKGYTIRGMLPGEASLWSDIWRDADPALVIDDELFTREFGHDWDLINERCLLVVNPTGRAVGTISAWMDEDFRGTGDAGRIHWVALRREWQGKGLAQPMMSRAMEILAQHHQRSYLVTQAFRLPAIRLYLSYGFVPEVTDDHARALWLYVASRTEHPALEAVRRLTRTAPSVK